MTTLYEHVVLGDKISMVSANFNIPFLSGDGNICLYENGVSLVDEFGNEKYIIELNDLNINYEEFINVRNLKRYDNLKLKITIVRRRFFKNRTKRIKGNYYGKLIIEIAEIGSVELFDNQFFKYKKFYEKIISLKDGNSPLKIHKSNERNSIFKFLKSKFTFKN